MYIIGELINGMYAGIRKAIRQRDKSAVQKCAFEQIRAGAHALDLNCGPASSDPSADMCWLVETVREVCDNPLSIDSSNPQVIEAALKAAHNTQTIINSITADADKIARLLPLAKKYSSKVIALTMSSRGVPHTKEERLELAAFIVTECINRGLSSRDLYLDPVLLPVNVAQAQIIEVTEAIREFNILCDPPPQTIVGLSNISQGSRVRSLINRTFLVMALAVGLDAAILDPTDSDVMDSLITAELLLNRQIYCDSYLEAYRRK